MSLLKIIRTNHIELPDKSEVRNYNVIYSYPFEESEVKKVIERFAFKHRPNKGTINVLFYTTRWAAEVLDYNDLILTDYIRYADEHPICYLNGFFMDYPLKDDLYDKCKDYIERNLTVNDLLDELYLDKIKDNPGLIRQYQIYKNEQDANKA